MIPNVQTRVEYTKISGGLDLSSPAMSIANGKAILAMNYEAGDNGGLRRIDGYERFDGSTAPSSGGYYYCEGTFDTDDITLHDPIEGVDSGAHGTVVSFDEDYIAFLPTSGTFTADEVINGFKGLPVGTLDGEPELHGAPTSCIHADIMNAVADYYRLYISKATGSGAILGGGVLDGTVYVFRNNTLGTGANLFKATAGGWSQIVMCHEISFDTGVGLIVEGDTITQAVSGATALVKRVVLETGAWGVDAAGRLIISTIVGTFNAVNDLSVTGVEATATSLATEITLLPNGRYETVNYNFAGSTDTYRMYGCDGVNRGFEFDGTIFVPISTGMTTDTPSHVACHKNHLFFSFYASLQYSSTGLPYSWVAGTGAGEIGIGSTINCLTVMPGETLGIVCERGIKQLSGSSTTDFKMDTISDQASGQAYTLQDLAGVLLVFSNDGVLNIESSADYGNFANAFVSRDVQTLIDDMKSVVVASSVYRSRNQYRVYGSDGTGLCFTSAHVWFGSNMVRVYHATRFEYPIAIACAFCGENDTIYIADDEGWLYQADKGSSFDGEEIESYFCLMFNHSKSPTTIKTYLRAVIEATSEGCSVLKFLPDFSYSDTRFPTHIQHESTFTGLGGRWDVDTWGTFYWDSKVVQTAAFPIRGSGENIAILGYAKSDIDLGHRIDGVVFHYIPRRVSR